MFPIPEICGYLPDDSKNYVFTNAEKDDQGSKVADFFSKVDDLYQEMNWQRKLRQNPTLFWVSSHMSAWSNIIFWAIVIINIIIMCFFPFQHDLPGMKCYLIHQEKKYDTVTEI